MYFKYIKPLLDTILSITGLLILLPLFALITLAIKFDSKGPIFFTQTRLGRFGKPFKIIKFRTMVVGAEGIGTGLVVNDTKDSRITRLGSFLRKTSLDELPQLINILKGDMSIVGPRPPASYVPYDGYDNYPEWAKKRFEAKPGITGLAQVVYRNNASWIERIKLDNVYVDRVTFHTDISLILKTIGCVLKREGIY